MDSSNKEIMHYIRIMYICTLWVERCYLYVLTKFTFIETIFLYYLLSAQQTSSKKFDKEENVIHIEFNMDKQKVYTLIHCIIQVLFFFKVLRV